MALTTIPRGILIHYNSRRKESLKKEGKTQKKAFSLKMDLKMKCIFVRDRGFSVASIKCASVLK